MTTSQTDPRLDTITRDIELRTLLKELDQSLLAGSSYLTQQAENYRTRYSLWAGQSKDGRKWESKLGKKVFPWEGASDARILLADEIVNEQVAMMMTAWRKSSFQVTGLNVTNQLGAVKVNELLKWLFRTRLKEQLDREVELFCQWRQTHGLAVMGVFWEQERRTEIMEMDLAGIFAELESGEIDPEEQAAGAELMQRMLDPLRTPELVASLRTAYPLLTETSARKAAESLQTTGTAAVPNVYVLSSLPRWEALLPFVDVFWPVNTKDIQRARWVAKREWLTETELLDRGSMEGWDEKWIAEALEHKGKSYNAGGGFAAASAWNVSRSARSATGVPEEDYKEMIEIWHMNYKGTDPKSGAPALMEDVFHPSVPDLVGAHRLCHYQHQRYPYITGVRERIAFPMTESRGVPDIVAPEQSAVKVQVDARTDATSMTTSPPLLVPLWRSKSDLKWGPGTQIGERRKGEISWLFPPPNDGRSKEIEEAALRRVERYFGRHSENVPQVLSDVATQHLIDGFLGEMSAGGMMTLQLAQQYFEDATIQRVVGETVIPFHVGREEIQGSYNLVGTFDARDMNLDYVTKKAEIIQKLVIPADRGGTIDYANLVALLMGSIDPSWAEQIVRRPQAATESEIKDEREQFAMLMSGQEPQPPGEGQNHKLRLQILEETLQKNPVLQQVLAQRPDAAAMLGARVQMLQFQIQQQENAMIGRNGGKSGLEQVSGGTPASQPQTLATP